MELTEVKVRSEVWWTFAFEAFGKIATVENDLRAVAVMLAGRNPPGMGAEMVASYPAWLGLRANSN